MRSALTIEFIETNSPMIKTCIEMITSGITDKIILKTKNKVVIDSSHVPFEKLQSLSEVFASTGYVKHISISSNK
jgi:tRNA(His) 5'-end guanylyltransferase